MREETITIYKFSELSDEAKQVAIDSWREQGHEYVWGSEAIETMKKFAEEFNIYVEDWQIGSARHGSYIHFSVETVQMGETEMLGIRVFKYLQNNYQDEIKSFEDASATGYCFDCDIIQPMLDFMKRPDRAITLHEIFEECFDAFIEAWVVDCEYQDSDEAISETIEINDYEFTKDGEVY